MTPSFPLRAVFTGLVLAAVSVQAQSTAKPTANAGPYQPLAQASPFNGKIVEERIAQVNEQIITSSDYDRAQQQLEADARQQNWTEPELAERRKDLLRDQIDKELLLSKGKELGITGETELIKRLDDIRKQNHLESMEDLEKAAQQQGVSYEDFKQNIRNEIISQQVIRDQVSRKIQLTKAQVSSYYQQHKSEFEQPESVHLAEIIVPVTADDAAGVAQAKAKADEVEAKLKAGASFEDMAKQYSSGPTAQTGGDLGDYKRGGLGAKSLEDAAFALKTGQVAAPIRTKQGYLILKATQHVGGAAQDYASIEPQVEEVAFMDRMQPELRKYLTTLREQAYIDIRPGYEDAGAATHTVKPLYSAYTPPGQKKKAKVQKARYRQSTHTFRSKSGTTKQASAAVPATPVKTAATPAATEAAAGTAATPAGTTPDATAAATVPATTAVAPAASTPAAKPAQVAKNTPSTKKVKKQKVRFGQTPSDTLAVTPGSAALANSNAGAPNNGETQVASNESSNSALPLAGSTPTTAKAKTRFAYRAREPKQKKAQTQDQLENASVGQATPEEQAVQKQESAPVDLAGDTAKKKKEPKPKSDHKTRYAQEPKATGDSKDSGTDTSTPAADTTPASTTPATPPAQTPPTQTPAPQ